MQQFFKSVEDAFSQRYNEFCDRKVTFIKELDARSIEPRKLAKASKKLISILQKGCNVAKPTDQILLSQAVCRMYELDRWYAVVSVDYTHMVNQRIAIDKFTLLTVSDPLYLVFHLDKKLDSFLKPKEEADKQGIQYTLFADASKPSYVV